MHGITPNWLMATKFARSLEFLNQLLDIVVVLDILRIDITHVSPPKKYHKHIMYMIQNSMHQIYYSNKISKQLVTSQFSSYQPCPPPTTKVITCQLLSSDNSSQPSRDPSHNAWARRQRWKMPPAKINLEVMGGGEDPNLIGIDGCFHKWWYPQTTPKWSFF